MTPAPGRVRVLVIGAGAAGLSAAARLVEAGLPTDEVLVLEARDRAGGRVLTRTMAGATAAAADVAAARASRGNDKRNGTGNEPVDKASRAKASVDAEADADTAHSAEQGTVRARQTAMLPDILVDVGASLMHGCADDNQIVFQRALREKIRAPVVAGGGVYECTEHARWFHQDQEVPTRTVVEMHALFWIIGRCMAATASVSDDHTADLRSHFLYAKEYVLSNLNNRILTDVEASVLEKLALRSFGYCSPLAKMALVQAAINADPDDDAIIGPLAGRDEDFGLPSASAMLDARSLTINTTALKRRIANADYPTVGCVSRRNPTGDRIVIDGYTPFLIDKLKAGLTIKFETIVKKVVYREGAPGQSMQNILNDSNAISPPVQVLTKNGDLYAADFAVVTLPIGVLQGLSCDSSVTFEPTLSEQKRVAIKTLGMGVHNKIILRFHPDDVFWPPGTPQLNCLDPRFQFFNLHAYGKTGVLLTHVFGGTNFAAGYGNMSDAQVVQEVLAVLQTMFVSTNSNSNGDVGVSDPKSNLEAVEKTRTNNAVVDRQGLGSSFDIHGATRVLGDEACSDVVAKDLDLGVMHSATDEIVEDEGQLDCGVGIESGTLSVKSHPNAPEIAEHPGLVSLSSDFASDDVKEATEFEEVVEDEGDRVFLGADSQESDDRSRSHKARQRPGLRSKSRSSRKDCRFSRKKRDPRAVDELQHVRKSRKQIPIPLETIVTRWDKDPFSMGSYSFLPVGADWDMIGHIAAPEPQGAAVPTLFFAGEHCNDLGWQCVHGACESGIEAANAILRQLTPTASEESTVVTKGNDEVGQPANKSAVPAEPDLLTTGEGVFPESTAAPSTTLSPAKKVSSRPRNVPKVSKLKQERGSGMGTAINTETIKQLEEFWDAPAFQRDVLEVIASRVSLAIGRRVPLASISRIVRNQAAQNVSCAKNFLQYHKSGRGSLYKASSKELYIRPVRTSSFRWAAHEDLTFEALRVGYGLVRKALAHNRVLHEYIAWQCIGEHLHKISGHIVGIRALRSRIELQAGGRCKVKSAKLNRLSQTLMGGFKKLSCADPSSAMESCDFKFPLEDLDDRTMYDDPGSGETASIGGNDADEDLGAIHGYEMNPKKSTSPGHVDGNIHKTDRGAALSSVMNSCDPAMNDDSDGIAPATKEKAKKSQPRKSNIGLTRGKTPVVVTKKSIGQSPLVGKLSPVRRKAASDPARTRKSSRKSRANAED
jgi:monoamine oxidase